MKLSIDKNVPVPAYQQVVEGISDLVATGGLDRGARLPSVRQLAETLGLNVNTVARAYRDLERAGVVDTMPGMGTFVAAEGSGRASARHASRGHAVPSDGIHARVLLGAGAPLATSWRDLLAAARALATAEGIDEDEFVARAAEVARSAARAAPFVACAASAGETADVLRAMPADVAGLTAACSVEALGARLAEAPVAAVITTFPAMAKVRAGLGEALERVNVIAVETEYTDSTVRALAALPPSARLALVTLDRERWDEEANDVMKIIGRHRWLKMVLAEGGERGLSERLEHLDAVLHVPRARQAVEGLRRPGQSVIELARQLTSRARERLVQAAAAAAAG